MVWITYIDKFVEQQSAQSVHFASPYAPCILPVRWKRILSIQSESKIHELALCKLVVTKNKKEITHLNLFFL